MTDDHRKPANDHRKPANDRRTKQDRRRADRDRREGLPPVMNDRRTRFSIVYFLVVLALLLGLNHLLGRRETRQISYSELKRRIEAGQVEHVRIGQERIQAVVADSARAAGAQPEIWTAIRVDTDDSLVPLLESRGVTYEGVTEGWLGRSLGWLLPVGLLVLFWVWMLRRINPAQGVMTVGRNRARIMGEEGTGVRFADVAGADEAKQELVEVVEFLRTPEKFARLGARLPKGVLVVGPPGTGKTLLARAVAGEAGVTFFSISGSEFVEMFVGVGASRVRDLFEQAKRNAPCIVFIDELDALGKTRGAAGAPGGGHDEREQTLNQLLVEMDGFDPRRGVIIMAATNRPEILDQALLRPGRFDRQVVVDRPDMEGRLAILNVHARAIRLSPDADLESVARRTPGFVGADLANLLNEAALLAARRERDDVSDAEIEEAIDRVVAGLEKRNRLVHDREREIVAYHESGHALVAERVPHADPVHKISIIPRGVAALGFTQQVPADERYVMQRPELDDRMTVLLAGRAAEETVFGEISTGASNDLERATDVARRMVTELGMSEKVGPVTLHRRPGTMLQQVQDQTMNGRGDYSEATAQTIDAEVRRLLVNAYDRARGILLEDRAILDELARRVLEKEVVDRTELRELMGVASERPHEKRPDVGHAPATPAEAAD